MNDRNSYNTKQKQLIYDFFAANPDRQFSAKEVSNSVKQQAKIGESTVYRLIKKLIHLDCGLVKEFEAHMTSHHGFSIDHLKTIIYGTCANCANKKEIKHETTI